VHGDVLAVRAVAIGAHPVLTAAGAIQVLMSQVVERVEGRICDRVDGTAVAAVASGRAAARNELLAPKCHAAISAAAASDADLRRIDEHVELSAVSFQLTAGG